MTLDFSALAPLPAPSSLPHDVVQVGEKLAAEPDHMLASFTGLFEQTENQEAPFPALVVTTSGSTGKPKQTVLTAQALIASGQATAEVTDSAQAQWLLALPVHYVAGAQVLARSALAGTHPAITASVTQNTNFTAHDFLATAQNLTAAKTMTALVPAQLHELLKASRQKTLFAQELLSALQSFKAILLGGAPASATLTQECREKNIRIVTTYGSAETAGGCVYNGTALPGVRIAVQNPDERGVGRIWLGGPTLAQGYLADPIKTASSFFQDQEGRRWYKTDDLGCLNQNKLTLEGRADDIIISGGIKVSARLITACLEAQPGVAQAFVCGIPHPKWGQAVAALIVPTDSAKPPNKAQLLDAVAQQLGKAAAPKNIDFCQQLPALSTGKPDRVRIQKQLAGLL